MTSARIPWLVVLLVAALLPVHGRDAATQSSDNVVLVTLDGSRTEEIFGGLDLDILRSTLKDGQKVEDAASYKAYWAPTPEERRRALMPFFWTLVSEEGSIAGNQRLGSTVRLTNTRWFSYPGYAELLLGAAYDDQITSNDRIQNPHTTVLETLRSRLGLRAEQVATFASWVVFNEIVEHTKGATLVNAGVAEVAGTGDRAALLNALQRDAASPWDGIRLDAFTFRVAMDHLVSARPRVLYIAFDETDDWAHDGRYDKVLQAYARIDRYLQTLWDWLQSQPGYRGRTHLVITTDHGRGHTREDWRNHGASVNGAGETWIAFASPTMSRRGEWRNSPALSASQIAATMASWMGVDWKAEHPHAGDPIR